eukprot:TRINITY_DN2949_c0_g1_i1.p1 TRINITY_DN2949_c0_g1~~TRINITY_DN2949_c0_g1_i1.p1  ORF type:complete len:346 (+),score=70.47 TRINITY_DN2949_c0_g1_i1:602-1639(+)
MEPMNIDWNNIESVFVKDNLYEHFTAPKYFDFSAHEESVDDDAWFCRTDCRHPKKAEDFKVKHLRTMSTSEIMPLGERNSRDGNLKRRGMIPSENPRSRKPPKNFRDNSENENPNLSPLSTPNRPMAASKTFKSNIKSSAEKKKQKEMDPSNLVTGLRQEKENPSLKSTHSAQNLFAGREILNQITEFCRELKKLALNASEREELTQSNGVKLQKTDKGMKEEEPSLESEKNRNLNSKIYSPETRRKKKITDGAKNAQASGVSNLNSGKHEGDKVPLHIRSCPPSPQRFPSPLKPIRSKTSKRGILKELEQTVKIDEENENFPVLNAEMTSMDMFWFLKPCTLGK